MRFEEAKKINWSLTNLGIVFKQLTSDNPDFVSYRDSALTWELKKSFGGNSLTTLIATCSPSEYNV